MLQHSFCNAKSDIKKKPIHNLEQETYVSDSDTQLFGGGLFCFVMSLITNPQEINASIKIITMKYLTP